MSFSLRGLCKIGCAYPPVLYKQLARSVSCSPYVPPTEPSLTLKAPLKEASALSLATPFTVHAKIDVPIICGAMYPCSNPELVAAVSEAGGIGMIQPVALTYVHGHDFRKGLDTIRTLTSKPVGMNLLLEKTTRTYEKRLLEWLDIALDQGVRFFVTALGNPAEVTDRIHREGGVVYHNVTSLKWAQKAMDGGVDGLICVNESAGGHAGELTSQELYEQLSPLGLPLVMAGGVGDQEGYAQALDEGYAGVQMGTRFIAAEECHVHDSYQEAIIKAQASDIVLTDKLSGVPCAVIRTPLVDQLGTEANFFQQWLLTNPHTKKWIRTFFALRSMRELKHSSLNGISYNDLFQAGKSVEGIKKVQSAEEIIREFTSVGKRY